MQVAALTKRYGDEVALAEVSFDIQAGEVLGLIGPNGAGKTTLLETIAGVLPADGGSICWRGAPLSLAHRREALSHSLDALRELPLGGTAAGTGINTPAGFRERAIEKLVEPRELRGTILVVLSDVPGTARPNKGPPSRRAAGHAVHGKDLERARHEMLALPDYDYRVVNHEDASETAADEVGAIVIAERARIHPRLTEL